MTIPSNLPNVKAESTPNYFNNYFVKQGFVTPNQYDALLGLLMKRTSSKQAAEHLTGAIIQGAAQQDTNVTELFDVIKKSNQVEMDSFLAFFLNNTRVGTSYLGVKNANNTNPYITRTILV